MKATKVPLVVPIISDDMPVFLNNYKYLIENISIGKIFLIGPMEIKDSIPEDSLLEYIDENDIVDISSLKTIFKSLNEDNKSLKRFGWYVQQFIKMKFATYVNEPYYLLWDSDTIPTKPVRMFGNEGKPYFDCKTEYHKPYFDTIKKLLPGCDKIIRRSFISEHMLIKSEFMRELICMIESNSSVEGKDFMEKILNSISSEDLGKNGFSEFETYGTFVETYHNGAYEKRIWHSLRQGSFFFNIREKVINRRQLAWLSKHYDAISFEKNHKLTYFASMMDSEWLYATSPKILHKLALIVKNKNRILSKFKNKHK